MNFISKWFLKYRDKKCSVGKHMWHKDLFSTFRKGCWVMEDLWRECVNYKHREHVRLKINDD